MLKCFLACYIYKHTPQACAAGANMRRVPEQTVEECQKLCSADERCKAVEYGVSHGGAHQVYKSRDCQLNSDSDMGSCNGTYNNLDLYVKYT